MFSVSCTNVDLCRMIATGNKLFWLKLTDTEQVLTIIRPAQVNGKANTSIVLIVENDSKHTSEILV